VIDDSEMMRKFLKGMLSQMFEVEGAESAVEGLEKLYFKSVPDLVILDLNMKEMNGYELLRRIRAEKRFDSLKVLILSGEKNSGERINCLEMGAEDYVVKPFNPKELKLRIAKLVGASVESIKEKDSLKSVKS